MVNNPTRKDEDNEPVFYCRGCHSLNILINQALASDEWDGCYCGKCGSTDIGQGTIDEWLKEEAKRKEKRRQIEWSK